MNVRNIWGKYFGNRPLSESTAAKILGKENVLTQSQFQRTLGWKAAMKCQIPYAEEDFQVCAEANKFGANWKLICKTGIAPLKVRGLHKEEFSPSSVWESSASWLSENSEPGYRLINFAPHTLAASIWVPGYKVAPSSLTTLIEALPVIKMITGERLFPLREFHASVSTNGVMYLVGGYERDGLLLYSQPGEFLNLHPEIYTCAYCLLPRYTKT